MRIESFSRSATTHNEDAFGISPTYGFVLDGATGLLKEKVTNMDSDAQWFSHEWKDYLHLHLPNHNKVLKDILKDGVKEIDAKYMALDGAINVKSKPSSGIALYRIINNKLEYFLLGDCSLIITKKDDSVIHLQPKQLSRLDQININRMASLAKEKGINVIEARPLINDYLVATRLTQNTDEGYYILSDCTKAIDKGLCGEIDFNDIKQVVALTDGYSQIYDTFNIYSVEKFAELIEASTNLSEVHYVLWNLQEKDKHCNKYPRFKTRDDATITVFSL